MRVAIFLIASLIGWSNAFALVVMNPPTRVFTCIAFDEETNKISPVSKTQLAELLKINGALNGSESWAINASIYAKESLEKTQEQLLEIYKALPIGRVPKQRIFINISIISGDDSYYYLTCPSVERTVEVSFSRPAQNPLDVCPNNKRCKLECSSGDKCEIKVEKSPWER